MADDTGNSIPSPPSRFNPRTVVEIGGTILGENPEGEEGRRDLLLDLDRLMNNISLCHYEWI